MEKSGKFIQKKQTPPNGFSTKPQNRKVHVISLKYIKSNRYRDKRKGMPVGMSLTLLVRGFNISGLPFSFVWTGRRARAQGAATALNRDHIFPSAWEEQGQYAAAERHNPEMPGHRCPLSKADLESLTSRV